MPKRHQCLACGMGDPEELFTEIPGAGWIHKQLTDCQKASMRPTLRQQEREDRLLLEGGEDDLPPQLKAWHNPQMADIDPDDQDEIVWRHSGGE
jgi:hypothetical protein